MKAFAIFITSNDLFILFLCACLVSRVPSATVVSKSNFFFWKTGGLRQSQEAELLFTDPEYFSCAPVQCHNKADCSKTAPSKDHYLKETEKKEVIM